MNGKRGKTPGRENMKKQNQKKAGTTQDKSNKNSYWNTPDGIRRRIKMIRLMLSGKYRSDSVKTQDESVKNEARKKIETLQKQMAAMGEKE
jgi:hypothetical protein